MATAGIDFDGVIHTYERGWHDGTIYGEVVDGALDGLALTMQRHAAFVFTSRDPRQVAPWLREQGINATADRPRGRFWNERGRVLVTNHKYPAHAYLDDRAVRFHSWPQALRDMAVLLD